MSDYEADEDDDEFRYMCKYLRRNEPHIKKLDCEFQRIRYPKGYGKQLGDALQGNDKVAEIDIGLSSFLTESGESAEASSFLKYLRESKSLKRFEVEYQPLWEESTVLKQLGGKMIGAIARNKSTEDFALGIHGNFSLSGNFPLLMRNKPSLKDLRMQTWSTHSATVQLYVKAFEANQSLESVYLSDCCGASYAVELILEKLSSHPRIREVKLSPDESPYLGSYAAGLSDLLSKTSQLTHLELCGFKFDKTFMTSVTTSLASNRTLVKLSFSGLVTKMDGPAVTVFCDYMRSYDPASSLQELLISGCDNLYAPVAHGIPAALMLTVPPNQPSSVGSKLQMLSIGYCTYLLTNLFVGIAANASRIRLPGLRLICPGDRQWKDVADCLPSWVSLRELRMEEVNQYDSDIHTDEATYALKHNGSLHSVTITRLHLRPHIYPKAKPFFKKRDQRLVDAYCERNKRLPELLGKPYRGESDPNHVSLYAHLLDAAWPIVPLGQNFFFMGLLSLGEVIGDNCDHKRRSSDTPPDAESSKFMFTKEKRLCRIAACI